MRRSRSRRSFCRLRRATRSCRQRTRRGDAGTVRRHVAIPTRRPAHTLDAIAETVSAYSSSSATPPRRHHVIGASRFLDIEKRPKENETVTLDFNRRAEPAMPCSSFTSCPTRQNILKVRVEAGDKFESKTGGLRITGKTSRSANRVSQRLSISFRCRNRAYREPNRGCRGSLLSHPYRKEFSLSHAARRSECKPVFGGPIDDAPQTWEKVFPWCTSRTGLARVLIASTLELA